MSKHNPNATLTVDIELMPKQVEYVAADRVRVTLKTKAGDPVTYTVTTASLVHMVNLSVALINNSTGQVFRDLGVF